MAISDELTRIQTAKADIKTAIEAKGVTVPSNALIDTYDTYIGQISGGGGGQAEEDLKNLIERDITSITIPSGVTSIGSYTFNSCSSLTSIDIPSSVTSIGNYAFGNCSSLTSVTIPSGVTTINNGVFQNCSSLTSINIPSGVTSFGNYAFYGCSSLTSINIPSGVTSFGTSPFGNCTSLTTVSIDSNTIVSAIYAQQLTSGLKNIFGTQVTEYIIGNNVRGIGNMAFYHCDSLTSVTIGNSLTTIGQGAFQSCNAIISFTIEATTPPSLGSSALPGTNANLVIYVPSASVEDYKAASGWSSYASRIQAIPSA